VPFLLFIFCFGFVFLVCFGVLFSICICYADFVSGFSSGIVLYVFYWGFFVLVFSVIQHFLKS